MTDNSQFRYIFKARNREHSYTAEERRRLRRDIREYLNDLTGYQVSLKKLCGLKVSYNDRNKILNLSLILINDPLIAQTLVETRQLPVVDAARITGSSHRYIEEFRDYIIAYMLLFGTEEHSFLSRQLSIASKLDGDHEPHDNELGFKLKDFGVTKAVLTPYGEFRFLDAARRETLVGDFITGTPAVLKPNRALMLLGGAGALTVLIIIFSFIFYQPVRSFTVMGEVEASFSFNRFGRLVDAQGFDRGGRSVLKNIVYSDRRLDSSLALFLDRAVKEEEIPQSSDLTVIVVEGEFSKEEFNGEELTKELSDNGLRLKVNLGSGEGFIVAPNR